MIGFNNVVKILSEVSNQSTANTTTVDFGNLNTGILQETCINTDLTEFIFYNHNLFASISFSNHLLHESCLTSSKESGNNIYFNHTFHTFLHSLRCFKTEEIDTT